MRTDHAWGAAGRGGTVAAVRTARVIPCLDVTAGRVVKGVNFVDLRDAGDPVELAARYGIDPGPTVVIEPSPAFDPPAHVEAP